MLHEKNFTAVSICKICDLDIGAKNRGSLVEGWGTCESTPKLVEGGSKFSNS